MRLRSCASSHHTCLLKGRQPEGQLSREQARESPSGQRAILRNARPRTQKACAAKGRTLSPEAMGDEVETGQEKQSQGTISWDTGRWQGEPAAGQMVRPVGARLQRQKVWRQQAWII